MNKRKFLNRTIVMGAAMMMLSSNIYAGTITKIYLNGNKLYMNPIPTLKDGATYLPIRSFEQFGFTVDWNGTTKTVTLKDDKNTIIQEVGESKATVNGKSQDLGAAAFVDNQKGSVMVPVRFVRLIGGSAEQIKETNTIEVSYPISSTLKKDAFGRPIKSSGTLPLKAKYYPYISMGIPADLYDQKFEYEFGQRYQNGTLDPSRYKNPVNMDADNKYYSTEKLEIWIDNIEKHLDMVLNFDYRTVSNSWRRDMASTMLADLGDYTAISISNEAQDFINAAKANKVIIQGDYFVEPSTAYESLGSTYVRVFVKFKITSNKSTEQLFNAKYQTFKTGVWYEGYTDIALGSNIDQKGLNFKPYKGSCIGIGLKVKEVR